MSVFEISVCCVALKRAVCHRRENSTISKNQKSKNMNMFENKPNIFEQIEVFIF